MSLQDHFHPPLSVRRHWHAFHNAWATYIASDLNQRLPEGYFAEPNVQFGIEIDVATFEESAQEQGIVQLRGSSYLAWTPPAPIQTVSFQPTFETVEISIFSSEAGPTLAGAIELVSPANKDRSEHRRAFVAKCIADNTAVVAWRTLLARRIERDLRTNLSRAANRCQQCLT